MVNEHNRYREEEQELETDNVEESTTEEINEETTYESTEVNKKEKKFVQNIMIVIVVYIVLGPI